MYTLFIIYNFNLKCLGEFKENDFNKKNDFDKDLSEKHDFDNCRY